MPGIRLGIDVGGTFTDFAVFDPESNSFSVGKTLSTLQDLSLGIIQGARETFDGLSAGVQDIVQLVYGTTMVANLLVERKGVQVGLITTDGFRDSLEMGTEQRYDMYDLSAVRAEPLVPRRLRRTISERVNWEGDVLRPLDLAQVDSIVSEFETEGVETIAVALMHSYRTPLTNGASGTTFGNATRITTFRYRPRWRQRCASIHAPPRPWRTHTWSPISPDIWPKWRADWRLWDSEAPST
jgi:N-methylhydantoinase A/oxoprolinase/acetone carboxylase beta subunit